MMTALDELSSAQRERLAFIEFRLWFLGDVTRKDVLERFGVATAAGTRDLALYCNLAPSNAKYEGKVYRYSQNFAPLFEHQPERVLSALSLGFGDGGRVTRNFGLPCDMPVRVNLPQIATLALVTRAIQARQALKLTYFSMKTGATNREIVPLALVDSGLRWHVRAYDRTKGEFRDLVLTRMEKIQPVRAKRGGNLVQAHENLAADQEWQRQLNLELIPHPTHPHPESIVREYGMTQGKLKMQVRAAIAGYVLRHWQVDCSPGATLSGEYFRLRLSDVNILKGVENATLAPGYR